MKQQSLQFPYRFKILDPRLVWRNGNVVAITPVPPPADFPRNKWEFLTGCYSRERADVVARLALLGKWNRKKPG